MDYNAILGIIGDYMDYNAILVDDSAFVWDYSAILVDNTAIWEIIMHFYGIIEQLKVHIMLQSPKIAL